ncbi:hypothetical protein PAPHI01_0455 [Pancytospora philotis]|nr:hypothetical protein PAPHI01_0455 [Pancytospora philotis]
MSRNIGEIEAELLGYVKSGEYEMFIQSFCLYRGLSPATNNTTRLKVLALLYYLAAGQMVEYRMLIQAISLRELKEEGCVGFLLNVEDALVKSDVGELHRLLKEAPEEAQDLMQRLLVSMKEKMDATLAKDIGRSCESTELPSSSMQDIKDILYVCREFQEN